MPYFSRILPQSPRNGIIMAVVQLLMAVALLYFSSKEMVRAVDHLASNIGVSPMGLALIIVPATTAIPETASALIWGFRGKDTLAVGSLVGEKILYCTFYPGLGLFVTSWTLDIHAYTSVFATTVVSLILLYFIARRKVPWWSLCFGFIFFIAYAVIVFNLHI